MRAAPLNHPMAEAGWQRLARLAHPAFLGELLARWWQTASERRMLAEIDPRLLRDMGIAPARAQHEAGRPFWQLPAHHETRLRRQLRG